MDETTTLLGQPVTVGPYEVRPWTLKRFALVYPAVQAMIRKLVAAGLTFENLEEFISGSLLEVLPELLPEIPALLAATLEIPLDEAEGLDWTLATALTLAIFVQNLEPLKNFSSLIRAAAAGIRQETPSA
jgi:hypothetical protein